MQPRIIKRSLVLGDDSCHATAGSTSTRPAPKAQKNAKLIEVAGEARAIELTCSCGEVTLIELQFDGAAKASEKKP